MTRPTGPREQVIVKECLRTLRLRRVFAWRQNSGALRDKTGRPVRFTDAVGASDIGGILPGTGRFIAVEVKRPGARTKPETAKRQELYRQEVEAAGGIYLRVESIDGLIEHLAKLPETALRLTA